MKEIAVTCKTQDFLSVDELDDLQGDLKTTTKEDIAKLKKSILKHGFSFPAFIWIHDNKNYIIDAHQRKKALLELIDEGYTLEKVPVVYIEAKDEKEAREKLLQLNSQYSKINNAGFENFIDGFDINLNDFNLSIDAINVPVDIDFEDLDHEYEKIKNYSDERIYFVVPKKYKKKLMQKITDDAGFPDTEPGRGKGILKVCGLL